MADWFDEHKPPAPPTQGGDWFAKNSPAPAKASFIDDLKDTAKQFWDKINPAAQARGVFQMVAKPDEAVKGYIKSNSDIAGRAEAAFKRGDYAEGVRHSLSYVMQIVPGLGSSIDEAGNKAQAEDYKGAVADTGALAVNALAAKYGPKVLEAATEPGAIPAAMKKAGAPVAAAVESLQKPGTGQIIKGGAQVAGGVATGMTHTPLGYMAAEALGQRGLKNILEGIGKRRAAGIPEAELFKAPELGPEVEAALQARLARPMPIEPPADPLQGPLRPGHPAMAERYPESAPAAAAPEPAAAINAQATQAPVTPPGEPAFVPPTGTRWGTMSKGQVERGYLEMLNRKGKLNPEQAARLAEMRSATPETAAAPVPESPMPASPEPVVTKIPFSDEAKTAATSAKMEAVNRSLKTDTLSRVLKDAGVDLEDIAKWKPTGPEWKAVTYAANEILKTEGKSTTMGHPSKQSIAETLFKLRKAAAPKVEGLAIAGKPAALAAAQALADEMAK